MYRAVTRGIRVQVEPFFLPERSSPDEGRFFWAYRVTVVNEGAQAARLMARHWRITDANGRVEEVRGPGVVGEQPRLEPGDSFQYTSGCPLSTPSGIMAGAYTMVRDDGQVFEAEIPAFSLDSPDGGRIVN